MERFQGWLWREATFCREGEAARKKKGVLVWGFLERLFYRENDKSKKEGRRRHRKQFRGGKKVAMYGKKSNEYFTEAIAT